MAILFVERYRRNAVCENEIVAVCETEIVAVRFVKTKSSQWYLPKRNRRNSAVCENEIVAVLCAVKMKSWQSRKRLRNPEIVTVLFAKTNVTILFVKMKSSHCCL